jgi:hypothetical protein
MKRWDKEMVRERVYETELKALAGLTLTSTWCLLGTSRALGPLKSKEESRWIFKGKRDGCDA